MYKLALLLITVGSAFILAVTLDPLIGVGMVLLIAGTTLLREFK